MKNYMIALAAVGVLSFTAASSARASDWSHHGHVRQNTHTLNGHYPSTSSPIYSHQGQGGHSIPHHDRFGYVNYGHDSHRRFPRDVHHGSYLRSHGIVTPHFGLRLGH